MKVSQRVSELETQTVGLTLGWLSYTKGDNSVKTVNGVMILILCTSSDNALYLYQVSSKCLKGHTCDTSLIILETPGNEP